MSTIIGLKSLRQNMSSYISQVKKGKSFTVVRKSRPIFKITPIDEWGDEGSWRKVIDFTEINKKGVDMRLVLKTLRKLNAED